MRLVFRFNGDVAARRDRTSAIDNAGFDGIGDGVEGHHPRHGDIDGHAARTAS